MTSNFGNLRETVDTPPSERQSYVTQLFDDLAPNYDRFNRWVSLFRDEAWRRATIALLQEQKTGSILDLAAGTGDLAGCAARMGAADVHIFDISLNMLQLARKKFQRNGSASFRYELGSAHQLPFKDAAFEGVVSGFAMRNVYHFLDDVLQEMHRVLKPGGRIAILELSRPNNWLLRQGFRLHLKTIMPVIGRLTAGRSRPFNYLRETTLTFLSPQEFQERLQKVGFVGVGWRSLLLGGIAIHYGQKGRGDDS